MQAIIQTVIPKETIRNPKTKSSMRPNRVTCAGSSAVVRLRTSVHIASFLDCLATYHSSKYHNKMFVNTLYKCHVIFTKNVLPELCNFTKKTSEMKNVRFLSCLLKFGIFAKPMFKPMGRNTE